MSRSGPSIPIPRTVPVLPLHDKVLLPGVVTRMQITRRDSIPLFEQILRTFDSRELSKCIIGAFPVRPPPSSSNSTSTATTPIQQSSADSKGDTKKPGVLPHGELIIPGPSPLLPNPRSSKDERALVSLRASSSVNPAHLHSTGCAARLVRLERAVGGFTVVLEGIYTRSTIHPCAYFLFVCAYEQMGSKR
jgi:ATP-dependent Lon protease